ncbi:MAG: EAL domain-containing protein (putative c-di-GMP-specific phosphodiesterase class I) [Candidatus Azotimanducaceae bacterium]|jgi:EAL domain-containing protein (putative c-di-GMP-specific phosphodiesterase class I)
MSEATRNLVDGEVLFQEGDSADCAYIVDSGQLIITMNTEEGEILLKTLSSGELVGEMGVVDGSPRTATATASGNAKLTRVTENQFNERLTSADPILSLLVSVLLERYRSGLRSVKYKGSLSSKQVPSEILVDDLISSGIDKIRLESELKQAMESRELRVMYQPILDLGTRKIAGLEALARWEHPQRGHISPGLFIALAEETSLIVPIGLYLFDQACQDVRRLCAASEGQEIFVSINVSARQVVEGKFLDDIVEITKKYGLKPSQLKLEITEGLELDMEHTQEWVNEARRRGFKIALDDFGTGFSSLNTIHKLEVDIVKIDRAFVIGLEENSRHRDLMRGVVSMMKTLGLVTLVEGIETQGQLDFVSEIKCEFAQGYLMGKPMPLEQAEAYLKGSPFY